MVEVENNATPEKSVFSRLIDAATVAPKETPAEKAKASKEAAKDTGLADDLPTIIASVLALVCSALKMPPDVQPNHDEITGVAYYGSRLLLRHIDVTAALTADTLDIIGLLSISAGWYMRVSPALAAPIVGTVFEKKSDKSAKVEPERKPTDGGGQVNDASTANFLDHVKAKANDSD